MSLTPQDIASMLDHSTLQPFLTEEDIRRGAEVALKYSTASMCARPCDVPIMAEMLKAKKWAATNNVPVILNEFGALNLRSTAESRINYLTAMREICDTLQIPWTHWGYTGNFSVIENGKLIEGLDKALGVGSK